MRTALAALPQRSAVVIAATLGLVVGGAAVAFSAGSATSVAGSSVTAVKIVRDSNLVATTSTTFVDVPGAVTSIKVPRGTQALIDVRFSASSICAGAARNGCEVRVLIGGVEAQPAGVNASVFDSGTDAASGDDLEAHMIERSLGPLPAGSYRIEAQMAVPNNAVSLQLDNWNLTAERIQVS